MNECKPLLYGRRATAAPTPLTDLLKQELYVEEYDSIVWDKTRNMCAKEDLYYPHPKLQDALWRGLSDVARHVIGRHLAQELRVQDALGDVMGAMYGAVRCGGKP